MNTNVSEKIKESRKQYYRDNREKLIEQSKLYRKNNLEKVKAKEKEWRDNNQERRREQLKQWYINNPEKRRIIQNRWERKRYNTDLKYKFKIRMFRIITRYFKENINSNIWENLVGYTLSDLKNHLQITIPKGYIWKDYLDGKLHIDHIIPMKAFKFETPEDKEFKECWSLHNLRLLSTKKNKLKSDKVDNPILLGLLIK